MNYILKPKNNPFGIISFSIISNSISSEDIPNDIISTYNLDKYHPEFSAYCNSYDSLFISGGIEKNGEPIEDFWEINHINNDNKNNYQIKHIKMPSNKQQHSMIFNIVDNSIIIIGGNNKKCLIYNANSEIFSELPDMNDIHLNPALLIKNNYLYAFDSFDRKRNYFEKIDLTKKGKWEKFFPKNYSSYNNKNFSVCKSSDDDKIIILGGEGIGHYTILYDISSNSLLNIKGKDLSSNTRDKTLYRINNNCYANFSDAKDNSIIIVNTFTNEVQKANFDRSGKTDFNFKMNEEYDISMEPIIKDKKLNKSVNITHLQNPNNEINDKIIFQSYNNNLNNNISEKIILRTNNKKRNLKLNENNDNNTIDNEDIILNNEINIDDGMQNIEIKIEQEAKENEINKDKKILHKGQKNPKFLIPSPSLNEQLTNISVQKSEKDESQFDNLNINLEEKIDKQKENINQKDILNTDKKYKSPVKFKLNKSYDEDNYKFNSNERNNSTENKLAKSMYINLDDNIYLNYDFDNHLFHDMTPNYVKGKNRLHSSSINAKRIKDPYVKSKKIQKRNINGYNYSILYEKIIDKSNLPLYENSKVKESYAVDNDFGNHRLFFSQYFTDEDRDINLYDIKNYTHDNNYYKLRSDISEKANKTDTRKRQNNNIITDQNNNRKYNITKIKNNNISENQSKSNNKINSQKNEPNNPEEKISQYRKESNKNNPIKNNIKTQIQIKENIKDINGPTKSKESEIKKGKKEEINNESNHHKKDELLSSLGNEYKENKSINNSQIENQNETNNKTKNEITNFGNRTNKLPTILFRNNNKSNNNNIKTINRYEDEQKEDNIQDNSDKLKTNNINEIFEHNNLDNDKNNSKFEFNDNFKFSESINYNQINKENEKQYDNEMLDNENANQKEKENENEHQDNEGHNKFENTENINNNEDEVNQDNDNNNNSINEKNVDLNNKSIEINISQADKETFIQFNNKPIDLDNSQDQEKEKKKIEFHNNSIESYNSEKQKIEEPSQNEKNVKIIKNLDNNLYPKEKEDDLNNHNNNLNRYNPEKKEIKINLGDLEMITPKEGTNHGFQKEIIKSSKNSNENIHSSDKENVNNDKVNNEDKHQEKNNNNNSGVLLGNDQDKISINLIQNDNKGQHIQNNLEKDVNNNYNDNEYKLLNNITETEMYQKENEINNIMESNRPAALGINEELINGLKKRVTKLINIKNSQFSFGDENNDYNKDNNNDSKENISINEDQDIEFESSFKENDQPSIYKVRNKRIFQNQFYFPKYSLEEQLYKREIILNENNNTNKVEIHNINKNENETENNHVERSQKEKENIFENNIILKNENSNENKNLNSEIITEELKNQNIENNNDIINKGTEYNENKIDNNNNLENENEIKNIDENDIKNIIKEENNINKNESKNIDENSEKNLNKEENNRNKNEDNKNINENNENSLNKEKKIINDNNESSLNKEEKNINQNENEKENIDENNENSFNKEENNINENKINEEYNEISLNKEENNVKKDEDKNINEQKENSLNIGENINKNKRKNENNLDKEEKIKIENNLNQEEIIKNENNENTPNKEENNINQNEYENEIKNINENNEYNLNKEEIKSENKNGNISENNEDIIIQRENNISKNENKSNIIFESDENSLNNNIENVIEGDKNIMTNKKNIIINKNHNLRAKLFDNKENKENKENEEIKIIKRKKNIIQNHIDKKYENNSYKEKNEKIEKDKGEGIKENMNQIKNNNLELDKNIFFSDKFDNNETISDKHENEEEFIPEIEIVKAESMPIEENYPKNTIKKPKVNFIVNNSNILNQITSTEIIKEEISNSKDQNDKNDSINDNIINDDNNKSGVVNHSLNEFDNKNIENKKNSNIIDNENINSLEHQNYNNNLEEIDKITNNPINKNIDENNNSFEEIDIIANNKIDKNEIINTNPILLNRKNQIDEKDLGDDSGTLKRKNEKNIEINDFEELNENIPNRINISKQTKLQNYPQLTLFELMDEPSYVKINIHFPQIKHFVFTKSDLSEKVDQSIKKLIRNGIPRSFIFEEKSKLNKKYTPQKIKGGKIIIPKRIYINLEDFYNGKYELYNSKTENIDLKKNINMARSKDKKSKNIVSLKYTNLNTNLNKKILGIQKDNNLLYKRSHDININNDKGSYKKEYIESKKYKQNYNTTTNKRSISPFLKKKINISNKMKINNIKDDKKKNDK